MKMISFFEKPLPKQEPEEEPVTADIPVNGNTVSDTNGSAQAVTEPVRAKPPTNGKPLASTRRLTAAITAQQNSRRSLNSSVRSTGSKRSLNSSVRSNGSYNYDDDDFDSDNYEDEFDDDFDDDGDDDDGDVLSRSRRMSVSKVEENSLTKSEDFVKLSSKLKAVPADRARQLRAAINAAGRVRCVVFFGASSDVAVFFWFFVLFMSVCLR